ncbi:MAG: hypothetical protein ACI8WB_001729 [Phenylobacterium sp.]|jgi:hypothetical protein
MTDNAISNIQQQQFDYSNAVISDAEQTMRNRATINALAGDAHSLQGTIADASQISMLTLGHLLLQLKAGKTITDIIASQSVFSLCIDYAKAQADGSMKMPFIEKPAGEPLKDIISRTNAVAELYAGGKL